MGSETLAFACYILSDESSIPFYSTSNGYNNINEFALSNDEQISKKITFHKMLQCSK